MRFQNGQWLLREGMACFAPEHIVETRVVTSELGDHTVEELVLFAPTQRIRHKGDTLGGIVLELRISTPMPGVIRVRTVHNRGVIDHGPHFQLNLEDGTPVNWDETEDDFVVTSGNLTLKIGRETGNLTFLRDGKVITSSSGRDLGMIKTDWEGFYYDDHDPEKMYIRQQLDLAVGETIYGMGERFTPFVKNGQSVSIWNEDGGTSTDQSYKNIPFYLSSEGYGLFVNHTGKVEFEVATEHVSKVAFSVPGESLDYFFIDGPDPKDVLVRYTDLTGKPALPAPWTFGLWLSTSFTTDYDEETVNHFIDGMIERDIPLSVFHFDCGWMREFHWMDFTWDKRTFPDPEGMLKRIHDKGIKICVWINPYVGQASPAFDEGAKKGYFLKRENGDVWQWDMWQPGVAIVDFTNPEAVAWYRDKLTALLDMGVDCFKTDFGERIPTDCVYHDGSDPVDMHNYYTYLFNRTVFELLKEKKGDDEAVLFARSATAGGQQFPVHWGGDCWSNYPSMHESLRGGLSLTLSGFGFWSHDIGGFEDTSTADVYKRWAAFGLLSTHSRLHGSTSYRVPWVYDDEAVDVVRYFTRLKLRLLPYLYSQAHETSETGIPMMRAMLLEYPQDQTVRHVDQQYMLGDHLVVAPIFNADGHGRVYLPAGRWTHYLTGETLTLEHGRWIESDEDYFSLPLWVGENSLIPTLDPEATKDKANPSFSAPYGERLRVEVYNLTGTAETVIHEAGQAPRTLKVTREGDEVTATFDGTPCPLLLVGMEAEAGDGCSVKSVQEGDTLLTSTGGEQSFHFTLKN